jgi:hypothetical protein
MTLSYSTTKSHGFAILYLLSHDKLSLSKESYSLIVSSAITSLHLGTTLLGQYLGGDDGKFTTRQHLANYFCLFLYVISELEVYYQCFREAQRTRKLLLGSFNYTFHLYRERLYYMLDLLYTWLLYVWRRSRAARILRQRVQYIAQCKVR